MDADRLRIELTREQQDQIKEAFGEDVPAVELKVEQLEDRVAPTSIPYTNVEWTYTKQ